MSLNSKKLSFTQNPSIPLKPANGALAAGKLYQMRESILDTQGLLLETEDVLRMLYEKRDSLDIRVNPTSKSCNSSTLGPSTKDKRRSGSVGLTVPLVAKPSNGHTSSARNSASATSPKKQPKREDDDDTDSEFQPMDAVVPITYNEPCVSPLDVDNFNDNDATTEHKHAMSPKSPAYPLLAYSRSICDSAGASTRGSFAEMPSMLSVKELKGTKLSEQALLFCNTQMEACKHFWNMLAIKAEYLSDRADLELEQTQVWNRLMLLFAEVTEQVYRDYVLLEYDKFVVFCLDQEPVWRKAARELQLMNEARLNSTGNIYERYQFQEQCFREKQNLYQEMLDYLFSLKMLEQDERSVAYSKARDRRRRSLNTMTIPAMQSALPQTAPSLPPAPSAQSRATLLSALTGGGKSNKDKNAKSTRPPVPLQPIPPQVPRKNETVRPAFVAKEKVPHVKPAQNTKPNGDSSTSTATSHAVQNPRGQPHHGQRENEKKKEKPKEEPRTLFGHFSKKVAA